MSVTEAEEFFGTGRARTPAAYAILQRLADVGLGYLSLGQPPASTSRPTSAPDRAALMRSPTTARIATAVLRPTDCCRLGTSCWHGPRSASDGGHTFNSGTHRK
jgi:hypothetical protein